MGTNYYFKPEAGPLTQFNNIHIGKSSSGWEFSFQAYDVDGGEYQLDLGSTGLSVTVVPPKLVLKSYKEWLEFLTTTPGIIVDEYYAVVSLSELQELVQNKSPGKLSHTGQVLRNHFDELVRKASLYGPVDRERNWKDDLGFSFSMGYFS